MQFLWRTIVYLLGLRMIIGVPYRGEPVYSSENVWPALRKRLQGFAWETVLAIPGNRKRLEMRHSKAPAFIGFATASKHGNSEEERLMYRINKGTLDDQDIDKIVASGGLLNQELEKKYDQKLKEKRDLDEKYGKDVFDYKNENGELVKEVNLLDNLESYGREVSGPEDLKNSEIPQGPDPV